MAAGRSIQYRGRDATFSVPGAIPHTTSSVPRSFYLAEKDSTVLHVLPIYVNFFFFLSLQFFTLFPAPSPYGGAVYVYVYGTLRLFQKNTRLIKSDVGDDGGYFCKEQNATTYLVANKRVKLNGDAQLCQAALIACSVVCDTWNQAVGGGGGGGGIGDGDGQQYGGEEEEEDADEEEEEANKNKNSRARIPAQPLLMMLPPSGTKRRRREPIIPPLAAGCGATTNLNQPTTATTTPAAAAAASSAGSEAQLLPPSTASGAGANGGHGGPAAEKRPGGRCQRRKGSVGASSVGAGLAGARGPTEVRVEERGARRGGSVGGRQALPGSQGRSEQEIELEFSRLKWALFRRRRQEVWQGESVCGGKVGGLESLRDRLKGSYLLVVWAGNVAVFYVLFLTTCLFDPPLFPYSLHDCSILWCTSWVSAPLSLTSPQRNCGVQQQCRSTRVNDPPPETVPAALHETSRVPELKVLGGGAFSGCYGGGPPLALAHTPPRPSHVSICLPLYFPSSISLLCRPNFPEYLPEVMLQGTGRLSFHLWTRRRRYLLQPGAGLVGIVEPGRLARAAEDRPLTRRSSYRCLRLALLPSSSCTSWRGRRASTLAVGEGGANSSNWWTSGRRNRFAKRCTTIAASCRHSHRNHKGLARHLRPCQGRLSPTRDRDCCHPRVAETSTRCPTNSRSSRSHSRNRRLFAFLLKQGGLRQLPCRRRHQTWDGGTLLRRSGEAGQKSRNWLDHAPLMTRPPLLLVRLGGKYPHRRYCLFPEGALNARCELSFPLTAPKEARKWRRVVAKADPAE